MKLIFASTIIMLTLGLGGMSTAGQLGGVVDGVKKAGEVTKEAAEATADGTKEAAKTTKDVVTGKAKVTCADGTTQTAKTKKAAKAGCAKRGGVVKHNW